MALNTPIPYWLSLPVATAYAWLDTVSRIRTEDSK
jgi:hypothetical protein